MYRPPIRPWKRPEPPTRHSLSGSIQDRIIRHLQRIYLGHNIETNLNTTLKEINMNKLKQNRMANLNIVSFILSTTMIFTTVTINPTVTSVILSQRSSKSINLLSSYRKLILLLETIEMMVINHHHFVSCHQLLFPLIIGEQIKGYIDKFFYQH